MATRNSIDKLNNWNTWSSINWKIVEKQVFRLQKRIYRASQREDVKLVHSLQRLLVKSYYGKLLATRKVTQDNQGRKTAGVDGVKALTPKQRLGIIDQIKLLGKCKPIYDTSKGLFWNDHEDKLCPQTKNHLRL